MTIDDLRIKHDELSNQKEAQILYLFRSMHNTLKAITNLEEAIDHCHQDGLGLRDILFENKIDLCKICSRFTRAVNQMDGNIVDPKSIDMALTKFKEEGFELNHTD